MPEVNESKLTRNTILSIVAISLAFNFAKFSGNTKPTPNQVRFNQISIQLSNVRAVHMYL